MGTCSGENKSCFWDSCTCGFSESLFWEEKTKLYPCIRSLANVLYCCLPGVLQASGFVTHSLFYFYPYNSPVQVLFSHLITLFLTCQGFECTQWEGFGTMHCYCIWDSTGACLVTSLFSVPVTVGFFVCSSYAGLMLAIYWAFTELRLACVNPFHLLNNPILPMRKLRHRKFQQFAWGTTASKWGSWEARSGSLALAYSSLTIMRDCLSDGQVLHFGPETVFVFTRCGLGVLYNWLRSSSISFNCKKLRPSCHLSFP